MSAFADGSNPYAFTGVAIPEVYAQAMVDYVAAQGYQSLAIGYTGKDVYGEVGNEATVAAAKEAGIDVVLDETFDPSATDFSPLITKVKAAEPDAFLVWGAGPAPVIITKQFAGSGIPLLMTGAQASQLYVEPAGAAAEGVIMTSSIAVPGRELPGGPLKDLVDAFTGPWLKSQDAYPPQFAFDGATGIQLLKAAIEKAGSTDREKVRDALESLDVLTPTGRFTFSEDDHAGLDTDAVAIVEVQDGDLKATPYSLERFETDLPELSAGRPLTGDEEHHAHDRPGVAPLRRRLRQPGRHPRGGRGGAARHHRPERRGQVDAVQPHRGPHPARERDDQPGRPEDRPAARARAGPPRRRRSCSRARASSRA